MTSKGLNSVGVLTLSDKGSRGEREDTSGTMLQGMFAGQEEYEVTAYAVIADNQELITSTLLQWVDEQKIDLIVTTG